MTVLSLPANAEEIHLTWPIAEGGIGITASTDPEARPYIGLYPINRFGSPTGLPIRLQIGRLMCRVVAGFIKSGPLLVYIDAKVTETGLEVRFCPSSLIEARDYDHFNFVGWGNPAARYKLTNYPANSNWPLEPLPEQGTY